MISPGSRIAVLFTSLVVSACGNAIAIEKQPTQRLSVVRQKLGAETRHAWISAIGNDQTEQLARLRDRYNLAALLEVTASNGKSALMVASKEGDLSLAKSLVAGGASVHETTITQGTAFMFAVLGNQPHMVDWLYEQGADIHVVGSNGWTALTIAAAKGNRNLLQWLLDKGANAQVRDVYRYTPLLRAVDNGYIDTARLLLELPDTDINAQDEYDNTALHHAVSAGDRSLVELLLSFGADPSIANRDGVTALHLAEGAKNLESVLRPPD